MRGNTCVQAIADELEQVGLHYEILPGRRHPRVCWQAAGRKRTMFVPGTASDWRSSHNARALVRRWLREDGVLITRTNGGAPGPLRGAKQIQGPSSPARRSANTSGQPNRREVVSMRDISSWRHGSANPPSSQRPTQSADWRGELEEIAAQLGRLSPDGRRPERYFEQKSELVGRLRKLARRGTGAARN